MLRRKGEHEKLSSEVGQRLMSQRHLQQRARDLTALTACPHCPNWPVMPLPFSVPWGMLQARTGGAAIAALSLAADCNSTATRGLYASVRPSRASSKINPSAFLCAKVLQYFPVNDLPNPKSNSNRTPVPKVLARCIGFIATRNTIKFRRGGAYTTIFLRGEAEESEICNGLDAVRPLSSCNATPKYSTCQIFSRCDSGKIGVVEAPPRYCVHPAICSSCCNLHRKRPDNSLLTRIGTLFLTLTLTLALALTLGSPVSLRPLL